MTLDDDDNDDDDKKKPCCLSCRSRENLRRFSIVINDDDPLLMQPWLCPEHGDLFLLRVGQVLGQLARGQIDPAKFLGEFEKFDGVVTREEFEQQKAERTK